MPVEWEAHPREDCYFCREDSDVLESHHIVPRRYGGSDADENLVKVCPTCHEKLERLYGERFYSALGVNDPEEVIAYVMEYLKSELDRLRVELDADVREIRDKIETIDTGDTLEGENEDKMREYVSEAMTEYYTDRYGMSEPDTDGDAEHRDLELEDSIHGFIQESQDNKEKYPEGVPVEEILQRFEGEEFSEGAVEAVVEKLKQKGKVYTPTKGYLRAT